MSRFRVLCALLSALVPGTGQIVGGARRRGWIMLAVVGVLLVAGVALALQGVDEVLSYVVRPRVLLGLLGLNVALLAFRLFAVIDAYQLAGARPPEAPAASRFRLALGGAALALLLLVTAVPHGIAGYYVYLSHDLLTSVFARESDQEAGSAPTVPPTTGVPASGPPEPTTGPGGSEPTTSTAGVPSTDSTTSTTASPSEVAASLGAGEDARLTVLLVGTDAGYGRKGARADVVMVATVDLQEGYAALFGIPRNTGDLPLRGEAAKALGRKTYPDMISNLYEEAVSHPELAPEGGDPGAVVLAQVASTLLGIPVDHYAVIDMGGFVDLVDAFGGITLNVKERVWVRMSPPTKGEEWRVYDIPPGRQDLDGHEALAFARSRTGNSDYDRMRRQRCVLKALLYQNGAAELALRFPSVVAVIRDHVRTDIPVERLPDLVKVRSRLKTDRMLTVGFTPPDYLAGRNELGYNILDQELVQSTVREIITDPEKALLAQDPAGTVDTSDCWKID